MKTMADLLNSQINAIFETTLSQCDRYHKDELALMGITIRSGSKKWDYSNCPEWLELDKKKKELEKALQARASIKNEIVDPETGEILSKPTFTYGKQSIILKNK